MTGFARNYLPLLFNLYLSGDCTEAEGSQSHLSGYDDRGVRLSALETIRLYAQLTPEELMARYIRLGLEKTKDEGTTLEKKVSGDVLCKKNCCMGKMH
jgi:hypothetical protein